MRFLLILIYSKKFITTVKNVSDTMNFKRVILSLLLAAAIPIVDARTQSITEMPLVLQEPGMDRVTMRSETYKSAGDTALRLDLYFPPGYENGSTLPVVIFNNGVGSMTLPDWRGYRDWAKLAALRNLVAVHYQSRRNRAAADSRDLVGYLRDNAGKLGIDRERMAIWTSSANVSVGLPLAMEPDRDYIRCAVVYYGSARVDSLRQDLPLLVVRAGLDSYATNRNMEAMVDRALDRDIPFYLVNYLRGQHAFDILDDTERSREIIRHTLDFLAYHLTESRAAGDSFVFTARNFYAMVKQGAVDRAVRLYREAHEQNLNDPRFSRFMNRATAERSLNNIGYQLLSEEKPELAVAVFELMVEIFPDSPNAYDSMADGYEAAGQKERAIRFSKMALEMLDTTELRETREAAIRGSAESRLKRLEGGNR